jgi:hypothetical protein
LKQAPGKADKRQIMKAKQADKQTTKPAAAERLPALVVESSLHVVADLPAKQATAFDPGEPRLELGDASGATLVSPIQGFWAQRRIPMEGGNPVTIVTTLTQAIESWASALERDLPTCAVAGFDGFLLQRAAAHLLLLDELLHELHEVENLEEQLTPELLEKIRGASPRWRLPRQLDVN